MSATLEQSRIRPGYVDPETPPYPVKRWTREQYHQLAEQGWFENERVELLEGWIVPKMVHNPGHANALDVIEGVVAALLPSTGCFLRSQRPIVIGDSEPEPDLAVVKGSRGDYTQQHPTGMDTLWVIEVSDSSRGRDIQKTLIYAAGGILNYWIVDIARNRVEIFTQPDSVQQKYLEQRVVDFAETIEIVIAGKRIAIEMASILPTGLDGSNSPRAGDA